MKRSRSRSPTAALLFRRNNSTRCSSARIETGIAAPRADSDCISRARWRKRPEDGSHARFADGRRGLTLVAEFPIVANQPTRKRARREETVRRIRQTLQRIRTDRATECGNPSQPPHDSRRRRRLRDCLAPARRYAVYDRQPGRERSFRSRDGARRETLGARALAVNLSDIAAMGGRPTACVVNLAVREGITSRTLERIYSGLRDAAREASTDIVGGNVTRARELSITIALLGEAGRGVMRRDSARPGDEIFVTGTLGDAALGWRILAGKLKARARPERSRGKKYLVERFLSPTARLYAGQRLAALGPTPPQSTSATGSCRTSVTSSSAAASAPRSTRREYRCRRRIAR